MPFVSDFTNTSSSPNVFLREAEPPEVVLGAAIGVVGVVGQAIRGPVGVPTLIGSLTEYQRTFGGYSAALANEGFTFMYNLFRNGATAVKFVRITDGNHTAASASVTGTIFRLTSPGTWGNSVTLVVTAASVAGYVNLTFSYGSESYSYSTVTFTNSADERFVANVIADSGDDFVEIVTQGSFNPAAGTYTFGSGSNGTAQGSALPDSAYTGVDGANGKTGLVALEADRDVELIVCSRANTAVATAILNHVNLGGISPRLGIGSFASGQTVSAVATLMSTFNSDRMVIVYPWLQINNPYNLNRKEMVNPTSFLAGLLSQFAYNVSPTRRQLNGAIATERPLSDTDLNTLANNRICAIAVFGGGITVMNGFNTSVNPAKRQITRRRAVNYFAKTFESAAQRFVGRNHTEQLRQELKTAFNGLLSNEARLQRIGQIRGTTPYKVVCDGSNNTDATYRAGQMIVDVQISLWANADYILITLDASEAKVIV